MCPVTLWLQQFVFKDIIQPSPSTRIITLTRYFPPLAGPGVPAVMLLSLDDVDCEYLVCLVIILNTLVLA